MEIIRLSSENTQECAARAQVLLRAGGVIVYPTDTLYGLGADAFSDEAVGKIYSIKGRDPGKPIHCVVADLATAEMYAEVNDSARALARAFLPGPLTLVLNKRAGLKTGIARGIETIGIRIPANEFCLDLARVGGPFTTTSANASGAASPRRIPDIIAQLGERASLIDLVVDGGELPERRPSTVVDVSSGTPVVLREGAISAEAVLGV